MKKLECLPIDNNIKETLEKNSLGRNSKLTQMAKLLNNFDENTILSIDGDWGVGKTFFIKQFLYLNNKENASHNFNDIDKEEFSKYDEKYFSIYYNAWENDNHTSPIKSLIFNILNEFPKYQDELSNPNEIFGSVKPLLKNIIDKLSGGIINKECFENLKSFSDLAEEINTIEEIKNSLNKLLSIITKKRRITLIIDELDRCKPDYAIKMLEAIKNFYTNNNLTIIVVTNNKQLAHTVKKFYGESFDGLRYLSKIYDYNVYLRNDNLKKYIIDYFGICKKTFLPEDISYLLITHYNFTLREVNRFIAIYLVLKKQIEFEDFFNKENQRIKNMVLIPFIVVLKIHDINMFEKFISGNGDEIIVNFVNFVKNYERGERYIGWLSNDIFKVKEDEKLEDVFIDKYKKYLLEKDYEYVNLIDASSLLNKNAQYESSDTKE